MKDKDPRRLCNNCRSTASLAVLMIVVLIVMIELTRSGRKKVCTVYKLANQWEKRKKWEAVFFFRFFFT